MINEKKMIVNPVPSKTWYWLHMNSRTLSVDSSMAILQPEYTLTGVGASSDYSSLLSVEGGAGQDVASLIQDHCTSAPVYTAVSADARVKAVYRFNSQTTASALGLVVPDHGEMLCIMDYSSEADASGTGLVQTLFTIGDQAHLTLVQIHRCSDSFRLINDVGGTVGDHSRIDWINVLISGRENDTACRFALEGSHSHAEIHTGYSVSEDHVLDCNYYVPHFGRNTTCNIEANGVLRNEAKKIFRGTIDFRRGSAGAKGSEKENVLLIDDTVSNQTLPVILCSEEDVEGTHGASIGKLDDSLLFYLQSRGMSVEQIYEMMSVARVSAAAGLIPDKETREELEAYLETRKDKE